MLTCDTVSPARRSRVYKAGKFPSRPMRAGGGRCPMASVPVSSTQSNHRPPSPSSAAESPLLFSLFSSLLSLRTGKQALLVSSHASTLRLAHVITSSQTITVELVALVPGTGPGHDQTGQLLCTAAVRTTALPKSRKPRQWLCPWQAHRSTRRPLQGMPH